MNAGAITVLAVIGLAAVLCGLCAAGVDLSSLIPRRFRKKTFRESMSEDPLFQEYKRSGAGFNDPIPERSDYRYRNYRDAP